MGCASGVSIAKTALQSEMVAYDRATMWAAASVKGSNPVCEWLVPRGEIFKFHWGIIKCKCGCLHRSVAQRLQGVRNHERRRSDFVVQSEWFPRCLSGTAFQPELRHTLCPKPPRVTRALSCWSQFLLCSHCIEDARWDPTLVGSTGQHSMASSP